MTPRESLFGLPPLGTKTCTRCKTTKLESEFHIGTVSIKGKRNTRMGKCKTCFTSICAGTKKAAAPPRPAVGSGYLCPICDLNEIQISPPGKWCKDHDHITGKFRGYLCQSCNLGLGNFKDEPLNIIKAAGYLVNS